MKIMLKILLVFVFSAFLSYLVVDFLRMANPPKSICYNKTKELIAVIDNDTIKASVCRYSTHTYKIPGNELYFSYCEHINDSVHIHQFKPIEKNLRILKFL